MRLVGTRVRRSEDPRLLTGKGNYIADLRKRRMAHVAFVHSPHAHADIERIDPNRAMQLPGVIAVFTAADLATVAGPLAPQHRGGIRAPAHTALCTDRARFAGDLVAMVVAQSRAVAEDAAELVEVSYAPLQPVLTIDAARSPDSPPLFPPGGDADGPNTAWPGGDADGPNTAWRGEQTWGSPDAAFERADRLISATFTQERQAPAPLECRGGLAEFDPASRTLTYTMSHQNPHATRLFFADIFDLPAANIVIRAGDIGGSFGLKSHPSREDVAVCAAAILLGRPVKWIEDRVENLITAGHARDERMHVRAAIANDGELIGLRAELELDGGAYPLLNIPLNLFADIIKVLLPGTLRLQHYEFKARVLTTNKASYVAYRGPWEIECFVRERLMDLIAHELGLDPLDVRERNLRGDADYPGQMLTGADLTHMTINETLRVAADRVDYRGFRRRQREARAQGRLYGIGLCTYLEPGPGPPNYGQALGFTYEQRSLQRARVTIELDGTVTVFTAQQPHGQSHETTLAQIAADELGVDLRSVRVVHGDTRLQPFNMVATGGSRAATLASGAVHGACQILREQLLEIAADRLEAAVADLVFDDAALTVRGSPTRRVTFAEIARAALLAPLTLPSALGQGLDATYDFDTPPGGWTQSTHVCFVEVDAATGIVRIPRYLIVEDCGRLINPAVVEGQIRGGVAQGIGGVLHERIAFDEHGNPLSSSLLDYLLPTALDLPPIEIVHIDAPDQHEIAYRGVGEGGAIGAPAAAANAVFDALSGLVSPAGTQHLAPAAVVDAIAGARPPRESSSR